MISPRSIPLFTLFMLTTSITSPITAARAADSTAGGVSSAIEKIIVTAQKRAERLQDVPISIAVVRGEDLDRSSVKDTNDALSRVPGVSFQQDTVGGLTQVAMRGVKASNTFGAGSATTGYYLDSIPFGFAKNSFTVNPDVYDLERVEVLRGPQGTLYGVSSLNGVVRVLTKDANLDRYELKVRGSISNTELGGWGYRGDVAGNVPIVEGKLAARVVAGYQKASGWIDRPNQKDANDTRRRNVRVKLNAQPTDQLSIGAFAWISHEHNGAPPFGETRGSVSNSFAEPSSVDFDAYGVKIGYDFAGATLTNTASYLDFKNVNFTSLGLPFASSVRVHAETFADELYLNSKGTEFWRWSLGGMYRHTWNRTHTIIPVLPLPTDTKDISNSYAAFGELTRLFLDGQIELTGGLRYFHDTVGLREASRLGFAPPARFVIADGSFHAVTPRAVLTWHPQKDMSLYASYSEGFRSGTFPAPTALAVAPIPPATPDKLRNYEIGAKGSVDDHFSFDTAIYYMDWRKAQLTTVVYYLNVPIPAVANTKGAHGLGVDAGVVVRPVDALALSANLSWNNLKLESDLFSGTRVVAQSGTRLDLSPEYTGSFSADYTFPVGHNGLEGKISASATFTSSTIERSIQNNVLNFNHNDAIWIARASISVTAREHWSASLFVDNLNNEDGSPRFAFGNQKFQTRPRTTGLQFEYHL